MNPSNILTLAVNTILEPPICNAPSNVSHVNPLRFQGQGVQIFHAGFCKYTDAGFCKYTDPGFCKYTDAGFCKYTDAGFCKYTDAGFCKYTDKFIMPYG